MTDHQTNVFSLHFNLGALYCQRLQEVETTSRDDNKKKEKRGSNKETTQHIPESNGFSTTLQLASGLV